ncbi:MAG: HypC/HybG/HupF family hydrogenase formation chaperone [Spirochaetes bacterium]|nr:HypC/HybG/HupF family hydrogenase formation chaperone [Spirochaetota bacterium]
MCLGIPAKVLSIQGDSARVSINDVEYEASLSMVEDVAVGDFLIVHAGYAIEKLDQEQAFETLKMFEQIQDE